MRTTTKTGLGLVLIGLGVVGLLMPIVPGVPFFIAGAALLGRDHPLIRAFIERVERWRRHRKEDSR